MGVADYCDELPTLREASYIPLLVACFPQGMPIGLCPSPKGRREPEFQFPLPLGLSITQISSKPPHSFGSPRPKWAREKDFRLPFWEQGRGDEGNPVQRCTDFCGMDNLKKRGTGLKVPLFKGDLGGSNRFATSNRTFPTSS
jgi:hypothetical protein